MHWVFSCFAESCENCHCEGNLVEKGDHYEVLVPDKIFFVAAAHLEDNSGQINA